MRKILAVLLILQLGIALSGCGSTSENAKNGTTENISESGKESDSEPTSAEGDDVGSIDEDVEIVTAWSEYELNGFGEILYPGFTLDNTIINGKSYRTLVSGEGIRIVDNGIMPLSNVDNDLSGVYTFTIISGDYISTNTVKSPIGGYAGSPYMAMTPKVMETDVTGDGIDDIIIRDEDYDKDDGRTWTSLYVYDVTQQPILILPSDDIYRKLQNQFTVTAMIFENGIASCTISDNNGNTVEFYEELSDSVIAVSDIDVEYCSNYVMVEDGVIYAGIWLSAHYDYEDGYMPVTGNYTAYAAALRIPLVFDDDAHSFIYSDDSKIELVETNTYNYAETIDSQVWNEAWNNAQ